jgi:hypothetical protein
MNNNVWYWISSNMDEFFKFFKNEFKNTFKVYLYMIRLIDVSCDKYQT